MELGEYGMNTYLLRLVACLFLTVSLNSFAALSIRDLDGDWSNGHEGVYDDVLDITWLADANYAHTVGYSLPSHYGSMNWHNARSFSEDLSIGQYADWRLPMADINGDGCGVWNEAFCADNEMMIFAEALLGGVGFGINTNVVKGPFINVSAHGYWTDTLLTEVSAIQHSFYISDNGVIRDGLINYSSGWTWPVHDGDIGASPVPLPAGIYLFLSGLVGLGLMRGRNA